MSDQPKKVLIVEDRADWRDILGMTLGQKGYIPRPASSYEEAIEALTDQMFHLAVVDPVLDMANRFNRDGLSIVQKIRETQPKTPIIVITGSLTHDMEVSLEMLDPNAPVLFKESWDAAQFGNLVDKLAGQPSAGAANVEQEQRKDSEAVKEGLLMPPSPEETAGRPRVLLVENREDWQSIVTAVLAKNDYFWRVASTAEAALAQLEEQSFHLVILDLKLQATDLPLRSNEGWLLLDYLVEKHPKTQVVILSGKASPGDVADLLTQYPIIGFIEKQNFTPQAVADAVAQAARSPKLRIQTFGQFQIWRDGQAIGIWEDSQAEAAVKLLLVRRAQEGRAVAADEMIIRLLADAPEAEAGKKLPSLISKARLTLEPDIEPHDSAFILRAANGYFFDVGESVSWDLLAFRRHLSRGVELIEQGLWSEAIASLEQGRVLYKADFLAEDRETDWIIDTRRAITGELCRLLIRLADAYAAVAQYGKAIEACKDALEKDPLLEEVYRRLMHFYSCCGCKEQALKTYRNCLKLFEELFGEGPAPATRQLYRAIANDEPLDCPPTP